jgi:L-seryl-tRNA(Ser) seleniumtransferase
MAGAEAAIVVHSYAGALWLALSTLAAGREVLVARAEVGDIGRGEPLPDLIASAHARLREVGATNRAKVDDYKAAVSSSSAAVLAIDPDEYRVVGQTATAELEELVAFARERELVSIAALGTAPLVDPPESLKWSRRSAGDALAAGADLVALRGDGLVGGPPCGILLGSSKRVDCISNHPLFNAWRLDEFRSAALAAALECHQDAALGTESLPVWHLLTTPLENLRNRAERIAPQLAQAADVASAIAVETRSPISAPLSADGGLESYGVALADRSGSIAELDKRLQSLPLPVLGRVEKDRLILDLRTVMPRQDRALVEAIVGSQVSQPPQLHSQDLPPDT